MSAPIPESFEQWRHCITVECGIPLTPEFITRRLRVWRDASREETMRFRRRFGDDHWRAIIGWFEQALADAPEQKSESDRTA